MDEERLERELREAAERGWPDIVTRYRHPRVRDGAVNCPREALEPRRQWTRAWAMVEREEWDE